VNHSTDISVTDGPLSSESGTPQNATVSKMDPDPRPNGARRRQRILLGVGVLALIAVGVFGYWYFFMRGIVYSDDARFGGHLVDLAPEINGRLVEVAVHEGQFIPEGAIVFRLDPAIPQAALSQAGASLASAKANLASSEALYQKALSGNRPEEIKAAEATVKRLQYEEDLARLDMERNQVLFKHKTVSQDSLDRAQTTYESARQNRENAVQNLILLKQGSRKEDIAAAKAAVELARSRVTEAEAAVDNARANLARCIVRAPFDGWSVRRWLDPGAMPLASQPVVSMFDPSTLRVDANIEEKYLHDVAIGDKVDISVDAYPEMRLHGRVTEILRAVNSQFSLIPAEGVSGTFIKVSQRVPLRVSVTAPPDLPLGPGMSVEVRIHSGTATAFASGQEIAHD
jgi:membrane fusion protein (multidrug efflux system)